MPIETRQWDGCVVRFVRSEQPPIHVFGRSAKLRLTRENDRRQITKCWTEAPVGPSRNRSLVGGGSVNIAVRPDTRHILISSQFTMPKTEIAIFLYAVATSTCSVRALDTMPIESSNASWMRYQCNTENSQAIIAIGEHCQLPNDSVVTISTDIRRLCWVTRIFGDLALVNAICRIAIDLGGKPMDD